MHRRTVASRGLAFVVAVAGSGCLSGGGGGEPTPSTPRLSDRSFRVTHAECGSGHDEASASSGDGRVELTGTISARDRCHDARLASASYDADADRLAVAVETHRVADVCALCISDLEYAATFTFEGGLPGTVAVTHASRGRTRTVLETTL